MQRKEEAADVFFRLQTENASCTDAGSGRPVPDPAFKGNLLPAVRQARRARQGEAESSSVGNLRTASAAVPRLVLGTGRLSITGQLSQALELTVFLRKSSLVMP